MTCGLIIEQRTHYQITDEPMKFLTLADWTGMVETELFAPTYRCYGDIAKLTHVWRKVGDGWRIARVLSYDHKQQAK